MKNIFLLICCFISAPLFAQTYNYNIELFKDVIGEGVVKQQKKSDGKVVYSIVTAANAVVMFKEHSSSTNVEVVMEGDKLFSCDLTKVKDGKTHRVNIAWNGSSYTVTHNGVKTSEGKTISYTTTHMFFEEPKGKKEVYVERLNIWVPIVDLGNGAYKTKVDGSTNFYTYKDGKLSEMRIKNVVNIYMKMV